MLSHLLADTPRRRRALGLARRDFLRFRCRDSFKVALLATVVLAVLATLPQDVARALIHNTRNYAN